MDSSLHSKFLHNGNVINTNALPLGQLEVIYKNTYEIIENLDEYALKEIFSGNEKDIDKILGILFEETQKCLFAPNKGAIKSDSFNYLDKLTDNFDRELKRRSFNYFVMSVLPEFEMGLHHIEWGNLIQFYKWLNIIAARDHSKSYTFSFAYPIWKMYRYERSNFGVSSKENILNKKGMIITNEHSLAKEFLKGISEEIEQNPILREKLYSADGWGKETLTTKQGAELQVKGSGSALRGRHPGWIVIDDLLDDSALYSQMQREKVINAFHSVIMNMIVPGGQVIVVGTPYHESDLYANLKKAKGWRVFEYPAIFPDGRVLWSTRYDLNSLLAKKESQGSIIFSREILVKPITSDSSIFPWNVLENAFIGMGEYTLVDNIYSFPRKFKKVVLGCDFAISANVGADYTVFTTLGIDELDNYWVLNITRLHGASYNQQIAKIAELNRNFKYNVIMGEDNAFQTVMLQVAKDAGLKIIPHTTGTNKYDLKSGLPALSTLFEQSKIKLPRGDEYSRNMTDLLCTEANGITFESNNSIGKIQSTNEHDDTLFSLWIAVKAANYVSKNLNFGFL